MFMEGSNPNSGEDCFENADTFIPERWTTRPEMIRNMAAFNPFSLGKLICLLESGPKENKTIPTST